MFRRSAGFTAVLCVPLVVFAAGCGDDETESDAERFCGEAVAEREMIVAPPMATEAELTATLEFYRLMGELAPIAISAQWDDIVVALETASTIVPGDHASEQQVALQAYATERSAYEVSVWLRTYCGVEIPITTIAPQEAIPARTTTTTVASGSTEPSSST